MIKPIIPADLTDPAALRTAVSDLVTCSLCGTAYPAIEVNFYYDDEHEIRVCADCHVIYGWTVNHEEG